jgi:hypothetical protein
MANPKPPGGFEQGRSGALTNVFQSLVETEIPVLPIVSRISSSEIPCDDDSVTAEASMAFTA